MCLRGGRREGLLTALFVRSGRYRTLLRSFLSRPVRWDLCERFSDRFCSDVVRSGRAFGRELPAGELTRRLAAESLKYAQSLAEELPRLPVSGR